MDSNRVNLFLKVSILYCSYLRTIIKSLISRMRMGFYYGIGINSGDKS